MEGPVRFEDFWYEAECHLHSSPRSMDDVYSDSGGVLFVTLFQPHVDMCTEPRRQVWERTRALA